MAVSKLFRLLTAARGLLDLGRIQERRNNSRRADPNRYAGLHKLAAPFVVTLRLVAHSILAFSGRPSPYDGGKPMKSAKGQKCAVA